MKLPSGEKSCILHKCYPGTNHFLRVYAMSKDDRVLDVSKQLTVQTAAPPDTPVVTLRSDRLWRCGAQHSFMFAICMALCLSPR